LKSLIYSMLVLMVTVITGCAPGPVRVNRADVDFGGARVILGQDGYPAGDGHFCPPGQAKKGRC